MGLVRFRVLHCLGQISSVCSTRQMSLRFSPIGQKRPAKAVFIPCRNPRLADGPGRAAKEFRTHRRWKGFHGVGLP